MLAASSCDRLNQVILLGFSVYSQIWAGATIAEDTIKHVSKALRQSPRVNTESMLEIIAITLLAMGVDEMSLNSSPGTAVSDQSGTVVVSASAIALNTGTPRSDKPLVDPGSDNSSPTSRTERRAKPRVSRTRCAFTTCANHCDTSSERSVTPIAMRTGATRGAEHQESLAESKCQLSKAQR